MTDTTVSKDWKKKMDNLHKVVNGNGNPITGLVSRFVKMESDLKTNNKLTWAILFILLGTIVKGFF